MNPIEGKTLASVAPTNVDPPGKTDEPSRSFSDVLNKKLEPEGADGVQGKVAPDVPVARRVDTFVEGVLADEKALDEVMEGAVRGENLSQTELLELQARMYGYAQKVDLASKVVEKAAGGVKQLMQTQV